MLFNKIKYINMSINKSINYNSNNYNNNWGLGIGDWGLGIGPNPQSPIIINTLNNNNLKL